MGIAPRTFPEGLDVMKDDLSKLNPETKVSKSSGQVILIRVEKRY